MTSNVTMYVGNKAHVTLYGLSSETKPSTYGDFAIENGSVFIEMDTSSIYFYDAVNETWIKWGDSNV